MEHGTIVLNMDHKALFDTLLFELKDAVVACEPDGKIVLFNHAAEELLGHRQTVKKGSSLYDLCFRPPVAHALNLLQYKENSRSRQGVQHYVQFMNASLGQDRYYRCRVSFLPPDADTKKSFVIVFEDITPWYKPDSPLFEKIEEFRAPMTNLRAAIENITEYPEMSPVMRSAFENVLVQESLNLTEAFEALTDSCKTVMQTTQNPLTPLNTDVLFGYVANHLHHKHIGMTASPDQSISIWVDIFGFLLVLDALVDRIQKNKKRKGLACAAHIEKQFVYFDLSWTGKSIEPGTVKALLAEQLDHTVGRMTIAAILHSMDSDIWRQQAAAGTNIIRLAVPIAKQAES